MIGGLHAAAQRPSPAPVTASPAKNWNWLRRRWVTRGGLGYFVMGLIVLSGAVWSFGALVEIGNVATTKQSLTTLPAPYAGILFAGSVDLFIFYGYLKCYGPAWQIVLSVFHILIGLATSLWFQYWHSRNVVDPVAVSVVPALAVAVSLDTWVVSQIIDWRQRSRRSKTVETPEALPPPVSPTPAAAAATEAGPPPRSRPVAQRSGTRTLDKAHRQALYRAHKEGGAEKVEQVRVARGLPASAVPERWALPSPNGTKQEVRS